MTFVTKNGTCANAVTGGTCCSDDDETLQNFTDANIATGFLYTGCARPDVCSKVSTTCGFYTNETGKACWNASITVTPSVMCMDGGGLSATLTISIANYGIHENFTYSAPKFGDCTVLSGKPINVPTGTVLTITCVLSNWNASTLQPVSPLTYTLTQSVTCGTDPVDELVFEWGSELVDLDSVAGTCAFQAVSGAVCFPVCSIEECYALEGSVFSPSGDCPTSVDSKCTVVDEKKASCCGSCSTEPFLDKISLCVEFCRRLKHDDFELVPLAFLHVQKQGELSDVDYPITCEDAGWALSGCTCMVEECPDLILYNTTQADHVAIPGVITQTPRPAVLCTYPYPSNAAPTVADLVPVQSGVGATTVDNILESCGEGFCVCADGGGVTEFTVFDGDYGVPFDCDDYYNVIPRDQLTCPDFGDCCGNSIPDTGVTADVSILYATVQISVSPSRYVSAPCLYFLANTEYGFPPSACDNATVCATMPKTVCDTTCLPDSVCPTIQLYQGLVALGALSFSVSVTGTYPLFNKTCTYANNATFFKGAVNASLIAPTTTIPVVNAAPCPLGFCCNANTGVMEKSKTEIECEIGRGVWYATELAANNSGVCKRNQCFRRTIGMDPEDQHTYGKAMCDGCCDDHDAAGKRDYCVPTCRVPVLTSNGISGGGFEDFMIFPEAIIEHSSHLINREEYEEFVDTYYPGFPAQRYSCSVFADYYARVIFPRTSEFDYYVEDSIVSKAEAIEGASFAALGDTTTTCDCYYNGACPPMKITCEVFRVWEATPGTVQYFQGVRVSLSNAPDYLKCQYTYPTGQHNTKRESIPVVDATDRGFDICLPNTGRCCLTDGSCVDDTDKWHCIDTLHGVFGGQGSRCNDTYTLTYPLDSGSSQSASSSEITVLEGGFCGYLPGSCCVPTYINDESCVDDISAYECSLIPDSKFNGIGSSCARATCSVNYCKLDRKTHKCDRGCCDDHDDTTFDHCVKYCNITGYTPRGKLVVLAAGPENVFKSDALMEVTADNCTHLLSLIRETTLSRRDIRLEETCHCNHYRADDAVLNASLVNITGYLGNPAYDSYFCPPIVRNCGIFEADLMRDYGLHGWVMGNLNSTLGRAVTGSGATEVLLLDSTERVTSSENLWCLYTVFPDTRPLTAGIGLLEPGDDDEYSSVVLPISTYKFDPCNSDGNSGACCVHNTTSFETSCVNVANYSVCDAQGGSFQFGKTCPLPTKKRGVSAPKYAECPDLSVSVCHKRTGECASKMLGELREGGDWEFNSYDRVCNPKDAYDSRVCPHPVGACCLTRPYNHCEEKTLLECKALGGVYNGNGTKCTEVSACNDECCNATFVYVDLPTGEFFPHTELGTTASATSDPNAMVGMCGVEASEKGVWYAVEGTGELMSASLCNSGTEFSGGISVYTHRSVEKHANLSMVCDNLMCVTSVSYVCACEAEECVNEKDLYLENFFAYQLANASCVMPVPQLSTKKQGADGTIAIQKNVESTGPTDAYEVCVLFEPNDSCMNFNTSKCMYSVNFTYGATSLILAGADESPLFISACRFVTVNVSNAILAASNFSVVLSCNGTVYLSSGLVKKTLFEHITTQENTAAEWCSLRGTMYYVFVRGVATGPFNLTFDSEGACASNDECAEAHQIPPIRHPHEGECSTRRRGYAKQYEYITDSGSSDEEIPVTPPPTPAPTPAPETPPPVPPPVSSISRKRSIHPVEDFTGFVSDSESESISGYEVEPNDVLKYSDSLSYSESFTEDGDERESKTKNVNRFKAQVVLPFPPPNGLIKEVGKYSQKSKIRTRHHSDYDSEESIEITKTHRKVKHDSYDKDDSYGARVCISTGSRESDPSKLATTVGSTGNDLQFTGAYKHYVNGSSSYCGYVNGTEGVWYKFSHSRKWVIEATTCFPYTDFPARISVFQGGSCSAHKFTCVDEAVTNHVQCHDGSQGSMTRFCVEPNVEYWILVSGATKNTFGNFDLCLEEIKPCECNVDTDCKYSPHAAPFNGTAFCSDSRHRPFSCITTQCIANECVREVEKKCCYDTLPFVCNVHPSELAEQWMVRNEEQFLRLKRALFGYVDSQACVSYEPYCNADRYFYPASADTSTSSSSFSVTSGDEETSDILKWIPEKRSPRVFENRIEERLAKRAVDHEFTDKYVIRIPESEDYPPWGPPCCNYDACFTESERTEGLEKFEWMRKANRLMADSKYLVAKQRSLGPDCIELTFGEKAKQYACCANLILRSLTEECVLSNETGHLDYQQCVLDPALLHLGVCQSVVTENAQKTGTDRQWAGCELFEDTEPDNDYNDFVAEVHSVTVWNMFTFPIAYYFADNKSAYYPVSINLHVTPSALGTDKDLEYVLAMHNSTARTGTSCASVPATVFSSSTSDQITGLQGFVADHVLFRFMDPETYTAETTPYESGKLDFSTIAKSEIKILPNIQDAFYGGLGNVIQSQSDCCVESAISASLVIEIRSPESERQELFKSVEGEVEAEAMQFLRTVLYSEECNRYIDVTRPVDNVVQNTVRGLPWAFYAASPCRVFQWNLEGVPMCLLGNASQCVEGEKSGEACSAEQSCPGAKCYPVTPGFAVCVDADDTPHYEFTCDTDKNQCPFGRCYGVGNANERGSRPAFCEDYVAYLDFETFPPAPVEGTTFQCDSN